MASREGDLMNFPLIKRGGLNNREIIKVFENISILLAMQQSRSSDF